MDWFVNALNIVYKICNTSVADIIIYIRSYMYEQIIKQSTGELMLCLLSL